MKRSAWNRPSPRAWRVRALVATGIAIAVGGFGTPAGARPMPLPPRQVRPAVSAPAARPWHAVRPGPHLFFGTIAAIHATVLIVRLRGGRLLAVDASRAIGNGDYSAPLFIGKVVSVDGNQFGATFNALHIFRIDDLHDLGADR